MALSSTSLSVSLFLCPLPGYYFEIRSICAIRINTQVGLSTACDSADPCVLFLILLMAPLSPCKTSIHVCFPCLLLAWCWWLFLKLWLLTYLLCSLVRSTLMCWDGPWSWQVVMPSRFSGPMSIRMLWWDPAACMCARAINETYSI